MTGRRKSAPPQWVEQKLAEEYPDAKCALIHSNPFELLVATVLSAQTTDARVNQVTPALFAHFPDAQAMSQAQLPELENHLRSLGFFRRKSQHLLGLAQSLVKDFQGEVPRTLEELITLPGVGRKTANVVLGNCFDTPAITVDTHVGRISRRLGWTKHTDPTKAEFDLQKVLTPQLWTRTCHQIIQHGRTICTARSPQCERCVLAEKCPSALVVA